MITFAQISGGRTSGYMAYLLKNNKDTVFMFQNTGREASVTYDFINKMDIEWGLNIVWLEYYCPDPLNKAGFKIVDYATANREGAPFAQLNAKRKAIPNKFKRFCTSELKVKTARRYIRSQGHKKWNYAIGYRSDEPNRIVRSDSMQSAITPLRDLGITSRDVAEFWKHNGFDLDLPIMPNGKTVGGNCEGCFFHSEYQNAMLCRTNPQSVEWLIAQEKKHGHTFNDGYSFEELAQNVKKAPDFAFEETDHYCMETNGSCGV